MPATEMMEEASTSSKEFGKPTLEKPTERKIKAVIRMVFYEDQGIEVFTRGCEFIGEAHVENNLNLIYHAIARARLKAINERKSHDG